MNKGLLLGLLGEQWSLDDDISAEVSRYHRRKVLTDSFTVGNELHRLEIIERHEKILKRKELYGCSRYLR
jgi:hypothetical protein